MGSLSGIRRYAGLVVGGALMLLATSAISDSAVTKGSRAAGLDTCVAPTEVMRRNHMDYLKHDRNVTVHQGIRDTRYSLAGCVDCHAEKESSGAYKPVNAEGQFCASCHSYVAVSLTCFQCHSKTPESRSGDSTAMGEGEAADGHPELGLLQPAGRQLSLSRDELARLHAKIEGN